MCTFINNSEGIINAFFVTAGRKLDCSAPVGNERNFHTTWHSSFKTSENLWQCMSHTHTHTHTHMHTHFIRITSTSAG